MGDEFGSRYSQTPICGGGTCLRIDVGQQVLALYRPFAPELPECEARSECNASCQNERYEEAVSRSDELGGPRPTISTPITSECGLPCLEQTEAECPSAAPVDPHLGRVRLAAWEESILFAATSSTELRVSRQDLSVLWEPGPVRCDDQLGFAYALPDYSSDVRTQAELECE